MESQHFCHSILALITQPLPWRSCGACPVCFTLEFFFVLMDRDVCLNRKHYLGRQIWITNPFVHVLQTQLLLQHSQKLSCTSFPSHFLLDYFQTSLKHWLWLKSFVFIFFPYPSPPLRPVSQKPSFHNIFTSGPLPLPSYVGMQWFVCMQRARHVFNWKTTHSRVHT